MNTDKSFRIKSINCGTAQVWPISDNMYYVHWEEYNGLRDVSIDVGVANRNLQSGVWTKIEEAPSEESLPRTFKFKVMGSAYTEQDVYTYEKSLTGNPKITWQDGYSENVCYQFTEYECRDLIATGDWVVLPNVSDKPIDKLTITIDTKDLLNSYLEQSSDFLSIVKEFTVSTDNSVEIRSGKFVVYSAEREYYVDTEEELLEVMKAISYLEEIGNE